MTDEEFNRQSEVFRTVLTKLDKADLQALAFCFGYDRLVEVDNDKPWVASAIHGHVADLRRDRARLRELTGALRVLGVR